MPNGTPLQDAATKTGARVHFFLWILHETGDGIKHVFTLLVVEMVRGIVHHHWVFASYVANLPARGWTKRLLNWNPSGRARPGEPPNFWSFHFVDTAPWDVGRMKPKMHNIEFNIGWNVCRILCNLLGHTRYYKSVDVVLNNVILFHRNVP